MSSKENNFKEQFKQALISTAKVISEDYKLDVKKLDKNLSNKKTDFFDITNLSNKNDFVRLRAETDSGALKKKFSNKEIFNKNLPNNPSCKSLYNIAALIGAGGLGLTVYVALGRLDIGSAVIGGTGIVILAIILDRITQKLANTK